MKKEKRFHVDDIGAEGAMMTQVITDTKTGVQYLLAIYPNLGSGLTVMVGADGRPLLNLDR